MKNHVIHSLSAIAAGILLTACSTAEADPVDGEASADAGAVTITGVDYGFEGFPESLPAGTTLEFENASEVEYHEMAVMKLADDEQRGVEELLALPGDEAMASMTFVGVAAAAPGETGKVIDGDLTLEEAGRYVATCFIPVGADPAVVEKAFSGEAGDGGDTADGPPDMGDGAPHAMEGMVAEFTVE